MNDIAILLHAIQCGTLLGKNTFSDVNSDELLTGRDEPGFDRRWARLYEQIKNAPLSEVEAAILEQLREAAFKTTFKYSANPDLSGYISDDFELIGLGVASHCDDSFLSGLLESYVSGNIPGKLVSDSNKSLQSLVEVLIRPSKSMESNGI